MRVRYTGTHRKDVCVTPRGSDVERPVRLFSVRRGQEFDDAQFRSLGGEVLVEFPVARTTAGDALIIAAFRYPTNIDLRYEWEVVES